MKSTNSLNKISQFFKSIISSTIIKNNMKRFWSLSFIYFLFMFIMYPLFFYLNKNDGYIHSVGHYNTFREMLQLGDIGILAVSATLILTVVLSLLVLSYMHQKDEMIFTNSLPMTKLKLYISSAVSVAILTVAPLTVIAGLISCERLAFAFTAIRLLDVLRFYLSLCLVIVSTYSIIAVCSALSGTGVFAALLSAFVSLLPLILYAIIFGAKAMFIKGQFFDAEDLLVNVMNYTPLTKIYMLGYKEFTIIEGIINLLICLVLFTLGYFAYKYKKNERTSDSLVYDLSKTIIKYLITFLAILPFSLLFALITSFNTIMTFVGAVFGLAVGYFIIEMIIEKSFFVWHKYKGFLISLGVFLIIFITFKYDVFGIYSYIPKVDDIEAVYYGDSYYSTNYDLELDEFDDLYYVENGKNLASEFCYDREAIELMTEFNKKLNDCAFNTFMLEQMFENDFESYNTTLTMTKYIVYKLKNGKLIVRLYNFNLNDVKEELLKLYNNKEFKKSLMSCFYNIDFNADIDREVFEQLRIFGCMAQEYYCIQGQEGLQIVNAIVEDFINSEFDYEDLIVTSTTFNDNYFDFIKVSDYKKYMNLENQTDRFTYDYKYRCMDSYDLPKITPKYTRTIALLKQGGYYDVVFPTKKSTSVMDLYKLPKDASLEDYKNYEPVDIFDKDPVKYSSYNVHCNNCLDEDYYYVLETKPTEWVFLEYGYDMEYIQNEAIDKYREFQINVLNYVVDPELSNQLDMLNGFTDKVEAN